jgi:glycosyltransferase involved in cell wall biosynthesis
MTTPVRAFRLDERRFALESAFVQHLREMKALLGPRFSEIVITMSSMSEASYRAAAAGMDVIDEPVDGIRLVTLYPSSGSKWDFLKRLPKIVAQVDRLVKSSDVLHVDFSYDLFRPVGAIACLLGRLRGKRILALDDIDRRRDAQMRFHMGQWSRKTYLVCRYVYDPIRVMLYHAYVRLVDLMLFKEMGQVRDFGRGAKHVRLILDPNFSADQVVDERFVRDKVASLADTTRPLKLMYFGRLVPYKGVDRMIEAFARAYRAGAHATLDIMGVGEQRQALEALAERLGVAHLITWIEPVPYGERFFGQLRQRDVLLACPLSGDTPRSAWDALASGMPLVAFDTDFYRSMSDVSGAVELTPWPQVEPLAAKITELARDKTRLASAVQQAAATARVNTSEIWMRRRNDWVMALSASDALQQPTVVGSEGRG